MCVCGGTECELILNITTISLNILNLCQRASIIVPWGVPSKAANATWAHQRGALWAAQRVPSGHVAVVANSHLSESGWVGWQKMRESIRQVCALLVMMGGLCPRCFELVLASAREWGTCCELWIWGMIIREVDVHDKENFMLHPGLVDLLQDTEVLAVKILHCLILFGMPGLEVSRNMGNSKQCSNCWKAVMVMGVQWYRPAIRKQNYGTARALWTGRSWLHQIWRPSAAG